MTTSCSYERGDLFVVGSAECTRALLFAFDRCQKEKCRRFLQLIIDHSILHFIDLSK